MSSKICDITPFTLQDYPEHLACIIWFGGCNMLCPYCHNMELVRFQGEGIEEYLVLEFLKSRVGKLEGVVFCGGEPTLYPHLIPFAKEIKSLGYKIKLDTNGLKLETIKNLLPFLDYIALDFKAPKRSYFANTNTNSFERFLESLRFLIDCDVELEVRTTQDPSLLSDRDIEEIKEILKDLRFRGRYSHTLEAKHLLAL